MKNRYVIYIGLLILSMAAGCKEDIISHDFRVTPSDVKNEVLKDVAILYSDSAVVRVRISGKELIRSLDAEQGKEEFTKGVYAFRSENKDEITVQGNVLLTSNKKETMETDELIWNKNKEQVYTEKFVLVKTQTERAWGHGFVSNQNFTEWRIKGFEGQLPADKMGVE